MSEQKVFWRFWLAHEDSRQEAWLEAKARQGWHLVKPGILGFRFEPGDPREARYRLDYQVQKGRDRSEYLALFKDAGWEFLGEVSNRYYFRARPEALSPEIFTDAESRKDRIRRELRVVLLFTFITTFNTLNLARSVLKGTPTYRTLDLILPPALLLSALAAGLLGWCAWKLYQGLRSR